MVRASSSLQLEHLTYGVVNKSRCPVFIASEVSGLMDIRVMVSQAPERSEDWA
jgi:hypothetical protein